MKILAFILSFYLLVLSVTPCCAVDNCVDETEHAQKAGNPYGENECGNCSPFTLCGNCAGFVMHVLPIEMNTPALPVATIYTGFINIYFPQYISSFWQPPQLV